MNQKRTIEDTPTFSNEYVGLEEVFCELQLWRTHKENAGTTIPDHLWEKIFRLSFMQN